MKRFTRKSRLTLYMVGVWVSRIIVGLFLTFFCGGYCSNSVEGQVQLHNQRGQSWGARNFGASRFDYYRTVALPGALPMIFTGIKLGIGMALLLIVAAEMHGAQSGIGYRIWTSYALFDISTMFVSFLMMSILGYIFMTLVDEIESLIIPWKR